MKLKSFWFAILPLLKNKYTLSMIIFFGWVIFFDQNNLLQRTKIVNDLHQLEKDKLYYINKIKADSQKLNELKTSEDNLEKFAREQYLMKKDNEDIFIISDN
ncbi:MAG TPA: septum formation initiator family protein [Bacteroidales bacterium]|nr:septum formation initiator family protein [Bacteroidales bacterium]